VPRAALVAISPLALSSASSCDASPGVRRGHQHLNNALESEPDLSGAAEPVYARVAFAVEELPCQLGKTSKENEDPVKSE
jgi:hypothetical protein